MENSRGWREGISCSLFSAIGHRCEERQEYFFYPSVFHSHTHTWYNSGGRDEYIQGEETDHFFVGNRQKLGFCGEGSEALSSHVLIRFRWSRSKKRKGTRDTPTCFTFYFTNVLWGIVFVAWDTFPFPSFFPFHEIPRIELLF